MNTVPNTEYGLDLVLARKETVADGVVRLTLRDPDGHLLPAWQPGAHLDLILAEELTRQYSLCGDPADRTALQVAVLREEAGRGGSRYVHDRPLPDGLIEPDPDWVRDNIRTQQVPLLGQVTCHRVMLPQLRAALSEVASSGLASTVKPSEYGGCYVPRFIGRDRTNGLSLHSWGIAVDLNVPGNQRGTAGQIDRRVVRIFKKWGFAWRGDWQWTDPLHFELAALVRREG